MIYGGGEPRPWAWLLWIIVGSSIGLYAFIGVLLYEGM